MLVLYCRGDNPVAGVDRALVISGSDKRGDGVATTNIIKIKLYAGLNKAYANLKLTSANYYADLMDQAKNAAHIGYPGWEPKGSYPTATKLKTSYLGPQESYRK